MLSYGLNYPVEIVKKGILKTIHAFKDYTLKSSSLNRGEIYQEQKNIISFKLEAYFENQTQLFIDLPQILGSHDETESSSYANLFFTRLSEMLEEFKFPNRQPGQA